MFVTPRKKKTKKQNKEPTGRLVVWWTLRLISRHQRGSSMQTNSRLSRFTVQATRIQCRVLPKLIRLMTDGALQSHCGIWKQAAVQEFSYLGFTCTFFRVRFKVQISSGRNPWHSKWNYAIGECETLNWSLPEWRNSLTVSPDLKISLQLFLMWEFMQTFQQIFYRLFSQQIK